MLTAMPAALLRNLPQFRLDVGTFGVFIEAVSVPPGIYAINIKLYCGAQKITLTTMETGNVIIQLM